MLHKELFASPSASVVPEAAILQDKIKICEPLQSKNVYYWPLILYSIVGLVVMLHILDICFIFVRIYDDK